MGGDGWRWVATGKIHESGRNDDAKHNMNQAEKNENAKHKMNQAEKIKIRGICLARNGHHREKLSRVIASRALRRA